jgi:hypothetical protein
MAVTSCAYALNPVSGTSDERNRGTYIVRFQIMTNSVMGPKEVTTGALSSSPNALPAQWATYAFNGTDSDSYAYAQRYDLRLTHSEADRHEWIAEVTYAPMPDGVENPTTWQAADPTARPALYSWDREAYTEIVERDINGNATINRARQPYDEPMEQEATRSVLVVEKNVSSLSSVVGYARKFENAVNSETWTLVNAPARTALCREITSGPLVREGAFSYYRLQFRFAFQETGLTWDRYMLERGFKVIVFEVTPTGTFPKLVNATAPPFPAEDGEPVNEPVLLAADGTQLPAGGVPIFTPWRTRREVNFNQPSGLPF